MPISVLIVDDHKVVRQALRMFLGLDDELAVVGEAENGVEAVRLAQTLKPDVVLMDLLMPQMDGVTATEIIRRRLPDTEVIALTSVLEDELVFDAMPDGILVVDADGHIVEANPAACERITHLDGRSIATLQDFERAVEALVPSEAIEVRTIMPDGATQTHAVHPLARLPQRDLLRLFWIPYGVGVVYLAIGVWIYALQGHTPPGRAFALFCAFTALVNGLFFDLISTHLASAIWTTALALEGGARVC